MTPLFADRDGLPLIVERAGRREIADFGRMHHFCLGVLGETIRREGWGSWLGPTDRDDMLAELYEKFLIAMRAFDPGRRVPFRLFAYGTLRHRLIDYVRAYYGGQGHKRVGNGKDETDDEGIEATLALEAFNVERLTPDSRAMLRRVAPHVAEGKSMQQVREELGWSANRFSQRWANLREELLSVREAA